MTGFDQSLAPPSGAAPWRDEILELVLWLRGEGFDERLDPRMLRRFLGLDATTARRRLERLDAAGDIHQLSDGRYALTPHGEAAAMRLLRSQETQRR